MNYPKLIRKYIKNVGIVEIRPYLTTTEIDNILSKVQNEVEDYALRKMMLYSVVMSLCTDIKEFTEEEVSLEVIEAYYYNGVFDRITKYIKGYDTLIEGFKNLAISDVYARFEGVLSDFTKQFKDIDINKTMADFESKFNELKEVNKEKEMILNG